MSADAPHIAPGGPEAEKLLSGGVNFTRLLVAVSGGPDSMALLALLAAWTKAGPARPMLHVATIDHGLRPESASEALMVAQEAARMGLSHTILRWEGAKPASGVQEAARAARYALLLSEAQRLGCDAIATAHTMDDQAETVLLRLAGGSGPAGLAGMEEMSRRGPVTLWRPLLAMRKARLVATCTALGLPFVRDPANESRGFARGRLREVWPALAAEGLSVERLARFARRQAEANLVIDVAALHALGRPESLPRGLAFPAPELWRALPAVQVRALARAIEQTRARLSALNLMAEPRAPVPLEKIEAAAQRLDDAIVQARELRLTLAGLAISLTRQGALRLVMERPRRSVHRDRPLSLGKGVDEA